MKRKFLRVLSLVSFFFAFSNIYAEDVNILPTITEQSSDDVNLAVGDSEYTSTRVSQIQTVDIPIGASQQSSDQESINELISAPAINHKVTPNPNEFVNLFSGSLKLIYTDFSVPVAPGLNMEFNRVYSSDHYTYDATYDGGQNLLSQDWSFQSDYVTMPTVCASMSNDCTPVYVSSKGEKMVLFRDKNNPKEFRSMNNWHVRVIKEGYILTAPNGIKYSFTQKVNFYNNVTRFYLRKAETIHGQYITYNYQGMFLTSITSSNPGQNLSLGYEDYKPHYHHKTYTTKVPSVLKFNGKVIAKYNYQYLKDESDRVELKSVVVNNKVRTYYYSLMKLNHHVYKYYKSYLARMSDENGQTTYSYEPDPQIRLNSHVRSMRLTGINTFSVEGIKNGNWSFTQYLDAPVENVRTKVIIVKNNYYAMANKYFSYQNGSLWRAGTLISSIVYANNTISNNNILQKTDFSYKPVLQNNYPFKVVLFNSDEYATKHNNGTKIDSVTYRAVPHLVSVTRDGDTYTTQYDDYDEYDNPQHIIQTNDQGTREIKQGFVNIPDKNILGLRTSFTVDNKIIQSQEYDSDGNIKKLTSFNAANVNTYYLNGNLASTEDIMGQTTEYSSYFAGIPQFIKYADGTTESQIIDIYGQTTSKTNKLGNNSLTSYNDFGQVLSQKPTIGLTSIYSYPNHLTTIMERGSYKETTVNTAYDLPYKVLMGKDKFITNHYDSLGRKIFASNVSSSEGHVFTYDSLNRLLTDCFSNAPEVCTVHEYLTNNTQKTTFPNGEYKIITKQAYGSPDNSKIINIKEDNRETSISRDSLGYVKAVKQGDIVKTYEYDDSYNLKKYIEPETGITEFEYDAAGKLEKKKQGSNITSYDYNKKNYRLENVKYSDTSPTEDYIYDKNGNLKQAIKGRVTWQYDYDEMDRLTAETLQLKSKLSSPLTVKYEFNAAGHLNKMTYPDKSEVLFNPDEYGRPTQLANYVENINYHPNDYWQSMVLLHQIVSTGMDAFNRVNKFQYGTIKLDYAYDSNNNLTNLQMNDSATADYNYQYNFVYDKSGRLVKTNLGTTHIDYQYDQNDNITQLTRAIGQGNANDDTMLKFAYKDMRLNSLKVLGQNNKALRAQTFNYDNLGNIKADSQNTYNYGIDGNMQAIAGVQNGEFEYDHNNNRIYQNSSTLKAKNEVINFYTKAGKMLYEYDITNHRTTKYLHLGNNKVVKISDMPKTGGTRTSYLYNDALGSPIAEVDQSGETLWREAYMPFGARLINDTKLNKYWFIGKEQDSSGLSYFGARYYHPLTMRFMAPDPMSLDPENPFTFNRYAYGNNNPYKYVDPDGKWVQLVGTGLGAFGGFITAWSGGERNFFNLAKATAIGGVVGLVSTFGAGFSSIIIGSGASVGGDMALKTWTGHSDQITWQSTAKYAAFGAIGAKVGNTLGTWAVPKQNFPAARGTYTNYIQPTVRQLEYNHSELKDGVTRSMRSTIEGGIFGINLELSYSRMSSLTSSFYDRMFNSDSMKD